MARQRTSTMNGWFDTNHCVGVEMQHADAYVHISALGGPRFQWIFHEASFVVCWFENVLVLDGKPRQAPRPHTKRVASRPCPKRTRIVNYAGRGSCDENVDVARRQTKRVRLVKRPCKYCMHVCTYSVCGSDVSNMGRQRVSIVEPAASPTKPNSDDRNR